MIVVDNLDDPLLDPDFVPCRDERCKIAYLHRDHTMTLTKSRLLTCCPLCGGALIRLPRRHARCAACPWKVITKRNTDA